MRVPIRKPGKYTHIKSDPHITEQKHLELLSSLEKMKSARQRAAEDVKNLATDGDFSENAGYQSAKGKLRGINQRILGIEDMLRRAIVVNPQADKSIVSLGHRVTVESSGKQKTYQILGSAETDPARGIISHNSPLGSGMIGKKIGDVIRVSLADKEVEYRIIRIE